MNTSYNTEPLFVAVQPDWGEPVTTTYIHSTAIFPSRSGKEQRTRGRYDGRPRIEYQNNGLSKSQWDSRLSATRAEMRAVCIVPFWSEGIPGVLTDRPIFRRASASSLRKAAPVKILRRCFRGIYELEAHMREEWFGPGDWVYLWDGTNGVFRRTYSAQNRSRGLRRASWHHLRRCAPEGLRLSQTAANLLTLYPSASGSPELADNVMIYPCKRCRRVPGNQEARRQSQHTFNESLVFEGL